MLIFIRKKAQSNVEVMALITFLLVIFFVFSKYLLRGFTGRWQATGNTFGHGRQYDPNKTVECRYYEGPQNNQNRPRIWFRAHYFEEHCTDSCLKGRGDIGYSGGTSSECLQCMKNIASFEGSQICQPGYKGEPPEA